MIHFKSYFDLSRDIAANVWKLPPVDLVVGVPKSGLVPATMIASFLNRSLIDLDSFAFAYAKRSGMRRAGAAGTGLTALIVDDSINTGAEFRRIRELAKGLDPAISYVYCAVYGLGDAPPAGLADVVLSTVPQPRVFQWNYRNHIVAEHSLFDMDGVLCVDPTDDQNDDGPAYVEFCQTAQPLFIPQKRIAAIVTSRLEKYRDVTAGWLDAHGVKYGELIMLDLPTAAERRRLKAHAPFKAEVFKGRDEYLFVESNWKQALQIALKADKPVLCTETEAFLSGADQARHVRDNGNVHDPAAAGVEEDLRRQVALLSEAAYGIRPDLAKAIKVGVPATAKRPARALTVWEKSRHLRKVARRHSPVREPAPRASSPIQRVMMISTSFEIARGAGAAASSSRLRDGLRDTGLEVQTLSLDDFPQYDSRDQPISGQTIAFWNSYHNAQHATELRRRVAAFAPDAIVLGAVDRGILSPFDIAALRYPMVWVARDNWVHTGGCLFQLDAPTVKTAPPAMLRDYLGALTCGQFRDGCVNCPAIPEPRERVKARLQYELKRAVLGYRQDIAFAPISDWMAGMLRAAPLTAAHRIERIYNPIDLFRFRPLGTDKAALRRELGLPETGRLVLLAAQNTANPRKGIGLLADHFRRSPPPAGLTFVKMGKAKDDTLPEALMSRTHSVGFIEDEDMKVRLYNAVDAVLVPTLQESLSVVASDAICCGTPVVAFATSGLTDFVAHQENGYLARAFDVHDLMAGLDWVLSHSAADRLRHAARQTAEAKFDLRTNVEAYVALMEEAREAHATLSDAPAALDALEQTLGLLDQDIGYRHAHIRHLKRRLQDRPAA